MKKHTTQPDSATPAAGTDSHLFDNWFDPIEFGGRGRVHEFIETMMEAAAMPRARLNTPDSGTTEWKRNALKAYQRRKISADGAIVAPMWLPPTHGAFVGH